MGITEVKDFLSIIDEARESLQPIIEGSDEQVAKAAQTISSSMVTFINAFANIESESVREQLIKTIDALAELQEVCEATSLQPISTTLQ